MGKIIIKDILPFQEKDFFFAIREKTDFAKLVMYSARNFLVQFDSNGIKVNSKMKLVIDKMSRVFFYKDGKYFSVAFPFNTILNDNEIVEINTYTGKSVNNKTISEALSILDNEQFKLNPSPIDFFIEADGQESSGLVLLEEIFQFEPSYIRYDNDPDRINGKIHPLHHLDINYSSYGSFKLGLNDHIIESYFENLVDINTECSFINNSI